MGRSLSSSVYFTLEDREDIWLLGLILAIPPSRRGRILKAVLREALPRYLRRHHPEIIPLPPAAVPAVVEQARRPRGRRPPTARPRRGNDDAGPPELAAPRGDDDHHHHVEEPVVAFSQASEADRLQEAERKLDRLLRSLTK